MDARRLALVLAGVALIGAGCGGSSSSSSSTTSIVTTTSTTTAASTTSSAAATTSTSAATTSTTAAPKTDLGTFGPLGANPAVTITLPMRGELPSRSIAAPIEGGLLVAVTGDAESHDSNPSTLAAVGFDGTKRWVRSVDSQVFGVWAAPASSHVTTVLVALDRNGDFEYHVVSDASGQDVASTPTDLGALTSFVPLAFSPNRLLLGRTPQGGSIPDALRLYDLATNSVEPVELPSDVLSGTQYAWFGFDDKGEPTVSPDYQRVRAIYRNGSWVDDPSTVNAAVPPTADFTSDDQTLIGHQATGSMIWPDPQFTSPGYENSPLVADGDITIAALCTHSDNGICTAIELDGINTDTGDVVWTLPGFRMLGAVGNGYALINDSPALDPDPNKTATLTPGWILIDTRTGKQVSDDQHWSDSSFFVQGCCDDYSSWVERFGGVVVAQNTDVLRVWLPRAATPASEHTVSLP
jgi:hypothetical protein